MTVIKEYYRYPGEKIFKSMLVIKLTIMPGKTPPRNVTKMVPTVSKYIGRSIFIAR